jgi:hypothetical protein
LFQHACALRGGDSLQLGAQKTAGEKSISLGTTFTRHMLIDPIFPMCNFIEADEQKLTFWSAALSHGRKAQSRFITRSTAIVFRG